MFRPSILVIICFLLSAIILGSSARRWFAISLVRSNTGSLVPEVQSTSICDQGANNSSAQVNASTPSLESPNGNLTKENASNTFPVIKGESLDTQKTKLRAKADACLTTHSTSKCTGTREICRFTLPATPTYRKFMIGIHKDGSDPCKEKTSCHPGGGRPKNPDELQDTGFAKDRTYEKALSGELAEQIVDKIFKRSAEKGNPIINPVTTKEQLKALAKILHSSTLEREGCCFKLSGELKCFLAFLLLQRPTRRKRSCGCLMDTGNLESLGQSGSIYAAKANFNYGEKEIRPVINLSSVQLPVSLYGFQPPPLLNLP